ncbi:MAG: hypothetical protein DMD91_34670 [Candidatus Rokuibacteriota bacterium]|nr:MAG: hypothetical protein DMD91_34670 [Candidatus Rokubacteria bacterium]
MTKTVVVLPGEGIGIEVIDATCDLLVEAGLPLKIVKPAQVEGATPTRAGSVPEETKRIAREADGVLFGAAGPATTNVVSWLRWEMRAWAGVRPIRFRAGMRSPLADPDGIDYVIVRENSEGIYPGREGELADLARVMPDLRDRSGRTVKEYGEGNFAVKVVTTAGVERVARFACRLARARKAKGKPGKVTCVTKSNVLAATDGRIVSRDHRTRRTRGGRSDLRALPRGRRRAPPPALSNVDGRGAVHEPVRGHPVRSRSRDGRRARIDPIGQLRR